MSNSTLYHLIQLYIVGVITSSIMSQAVTESNTISNLIYLRGK